MVQSGKAEAVIVTNYHVIWGAEEVSVEWSDHATDHAVVLGADSSADIAVLRPRATAGHAALSWGDDTRLEPGDSVLAIGSPAGVLNAVSQGIIAAKAQVPGATVLAQRVVDHFFTDSALGAGASGGPLLDLNGRVVGVNFGVAGASRGLSIAIPASLAKLVVSDLSRGVQQARASLGLEVREDRAGIVRVALVAPASAADAVGVRPSDEIVSLNGRKIRGAIDFQSCAFTAQPGASAKLEIVRDGRSHLYTLTTSPLSPPP